MNLRKPPHMADASCLDQLLQGLDSFISQSSLILPTVKTMELINTESLCTIGILESENEEEIYRPLIMWNLKIETYISEKNSPYRAYGCLVNLKGRLGVVKTFKIFIKEGDFSKFERVRAAIVAQTHGELILNSQFNLSMWSDFVPKLLFDSSETVRYQRPARNIGLQWHYLRSMAFEHGGVPQLDHVEIVYNDVVYNGFGEKLDCPVNVLVPDAFPNKAFRVSEFKPSGLRGFLKNCLPPYTSTSKFRRDQQILVIIGATGQHFYRLIVHNTGSCPSLMLASYEPETQKSTAALVGLKTVSDPLQFFNLQSSVAAVMEQRSLSSLPTVYDDVEGESGQNKMMVGSMNAASKFTKGDGEEEQLGGTVYTKNLKTGMKMPAKIVEGRNNWLLMEKDMNYEEEDMGENCEQNFEHCNEMSNVLMPRDFLARLTRYFVRVEKEQFSFFQEAQREACEIMAARRPHWRKRKSKSASLFISIFFLIEKEVAESKDEISKELFVEAFDSRDNYIEVLMKALDRVDEVEATMAEGMSMKIPAWTFGDNGPEDDDHEEGGVQMASQGNRVDINELVMDTLIVIEDLCDVDKTKYVKIFHTQETTLAIQHTKVKVLAKEKSLPVPKFLAQKKNYPGFVTLKTETFTKMTASSSRGTANTGPGFCTSILLNKLSIETKQKVAASLNLAADELLLDTGDDEEEEDIEINPTASQDYPEFTQSQSAETLKVCELCNFKTRSKLDFMKHIQEHPKCQVCKESFEDDMKLNIHLLVHQTEKCKECGIDVAIMSLREHMANHELTASYRSGLTKTTSKKRKQSSNPDGMEPQPRLNSYHIFCRSFREAKKRMFPELNMLGINAKLREDWHSLTPTERAAYKPSANAPVVSPSLSSAPAATLAAAPDQTPVLSATPPSDLTPAIVVSTIAAPVSSSAPAAAPPSAPAAAPAPPLATAAAPPLDLIPAPVVSSSAVPVGSTSSSSLTTASSSSLVSASDVPIESTSSSLPKGQTTIQKCNKCGKMFLGTAALENHKRKEHVQLASTPALQALQERMEVQDTPETPVNSSTKVLHWFKAKSVWWPCQQTDKLHRGEVVTVVAFDNQSTTLDLELSKLRPFSPLTRIPRSRTAEWRRGYEEALKEFEKLE